MIPVIDLFAGPGGLAEGVSSVFDGGRRVFNVRLSIEKEQSAHRTLRLRAFYRQFRQGQVPEDYYRFVRGEIALDELYQLWPVQASAAAEETWLAELGGEDPNLSAAIEERVLAETNRNPHWVLIGGPPCQAYSLVGRSRNMRREGYVPEGDDRYFLYKEYLKVLASLRPSIFVMENVRGLLSAKAHGQPLFPRILEALNNPSIFWEEEYGEFVTIPRYRLFSLCYGEYETGDDLRNFIVKSENHGIPQARHRVFVFGVREDINVSTPPRLERLMPVAFEKAVSDLPVLRSGLSRESDSLTLWREVLANALESEWVREASEAIGQDFSQLVKNSVTSCLNMELTRGDDFVPGASKPNWNADWYADPRLNGVINHSTRGHIRSDLHRYLFCACATAAIGRTPRLEEFPASLLPAHQNALEGAFNDRFRVQYLGAPSKTITSHISKDGHYFIHPDPRQCRSLTVREAARLQTFPDNYYFCGGRTTQYEQVGNAVPPYLAMKIGEQVLNILAPLL